MVQVGTLNYSLDRNYHGGECCGIKHLYDFPGGYSWSDADKQALIKEGVERHINSFNETCAWEDMLEDGIIAADNWRSCIEVVLAESQLSQWCKPLEDCGFKQVFSFLNSNSGNECHVFMLETNRPA